jgi:hypothetical protein
MLGERLDATTLQATSATTPQVGSNRLPVLASSINDHLAAAERATRRGLEHAIAAGLLLLEAKELVDHGGWLPWLQANCRLGERQARTYMRLARHRHRLESVVTADLTIAAAEALVGRPKPERPHGLPGQLDMLGGPEVSQSTAMVLAASLEEAEEKYQATLYDRACLLLESMADETRQRFFAEMIEREFIPSRLVT